jgi:magnesium transporter
LDALQEQFGLHELAVEDAHKGHQRPKIEEYGKSLFVVLQMVEMEGADLCVGEVAIFVGERYVLSVRQRAKRGFTDVRARTEQEPELLRHGSAYVLYALMDAVVDRYSPVVDVLSEEIESIEERIFAGGATRTHIQSLYELKRKLFTLQHAAGSLMEATAKLCSGRVPPICAGMQDYFRDVYDHLARLNHSIDSLRDMVTTVMAVNMSLIAMQENEVTKRLAAYAALFAVPTMIAGVYGMNFAHMPELNWLFGYPLAIAAMVLIDAYLFYRFRKAKWL